eukprot:scaffold8014_cov125-Isochrysis_galbana.AAC.6
MLTLTTKIRRIVHQSWSPADGHGLGQAAVSRFSALSEPAQTRRHPGPHNARAAPLCDPASSTQPIGWLMRALGDLHTASPAAICGWRPLRADAVDGDAPFFVTV